VAQRDSLAITSGNSIENAVMQFAAMSIGMQIAPISPSYSLLPGGVSRIEEIARVLTPKIVFAQRSDPFGRARAIPGFAGAQWVMAEPADDAALFSDLCEARPGRRFDEAFSEVGPDDVGKILLRQAPLGHRKE
jgi:feruloyl-CoA synthase